MMKWPLIRKSRVLRGLVVIAILSVLLAVSTAHADIFGFGCITDNGNGCVSLAPQLTVDLSNSGGNPLFTIVNAGPIPSSIAAIYWDDENGVLSGFNPSGPFTATGVAFDEGGSPASLPSENTAVPPFTTDFTATADSPSPSNGINPGESLGITFDLAGLATFSDVLADMRDGDLRVGLHVISIGTVGGSDSLVNTSTPIPEPATMLLLGSGLIGLAGYGRKKFFRK